MNDATKQDWENLPLSEEALDALTSFFVALLEGGDDDEVEDCRQTFKSVRRKDMQRWLDSQAVSVPVRGQEGNENGGY